MSNEERPRPWAGTEEDTRTDWAFRHDTLVEERDHHAQMCALYTHAGLYDLAKEAAKNWKLYDDAVKRSLGIG